MNAGVLFPASPHLDNTVSSTGHACHPLVTRVAGVHRSGTKVFSPWGGDGFSPGELRSQFCGVSWLGFQRRAFDPQRAHSAVPFSLNELQTVDSSPGPEGPSLGSTLLQAGPLAVAPLGGDSR